LNSALCSTFSFHSFLFLYRKRAKLLHTTKIKERENNFSFQDEKFWLNYFKLMAFGMRQEMKNYFLLKLESRFERARWKQKRVGEGGDEKKLFH
jgi:hypothetical protein